MKNQTTEKFKLGDLELSSRLLVGTASVSQPTNYVKCYPSKWILTL